MKAIKKLILVSIISIFTISTVNAKVSESEKSNYLYNVLMKTTTWECEKDRKFFSIRIDGDIPKGSTLKIGVINYTKSGKTIEKYLSTKKPKLLKFKFPEDVNGYSMVFYLNDEFLLLYPGNCDTD